MPALTHLHAMRLVFAVCPIPVYQWAMGCLPTCDVLVVKGGTELLGQSWPLRPNGRLVYRIGAYQHSYEKELAQLLDHLVQARCPSEFVVLLVADGTGPKYEERVLRNLGRVLGSAVDFSSEVSITVVNAGVGGRRTRYTPEETSRRTAEFIRAGGLAACCAGGEVPPDFDTRLAHVRTESLQDYVRRVGTRQYKFEISSNDQWART
jgi:hypothetical protein